MPDAPRPESGGIAISAKVTGVSEALEKAENLCELLKKAKSLADDLAFATAKIDLEIDI